MKMTGPLEGLTLPEHARSTRLIDLAAACGATMTAAGAGQGAQSGSQGTEGGSGTPNGSEAASGGQGAGNEGSEGTPKPRTYAEVLEDLDEDQVAAIKAEMSKKNGEARSQRLRARAAEEKLAEQGSGASSSSDDGASGSGGQNGSQQQPREGNGSQQNGQQQRPSEGTQNTAQLAAARAAVARSKVEAIAATAGFADPEDAAALLGDLTSYVDRDFTVDADSIRSDVDDLLTRKPHLARAEAPQGGQQRPGRPAPDRSQGSSANGSGAKRTGVAAGADLYRERHKRAATT